MSLLDLIRESARYSINAFDGDGTKVSWDISFAGGYIKREHVKVIVTDPDGNMTAPAFEWAGDFTITIAPAIPTGWRLTIYRDTPRAAPTADYADGTIVTEQKLDDNARQAVFLAQEAYDLAAIASFATQGPPGPPGQSTYVPRLSFGGWKAYRPAIDLGDRQSAQTILDLGVRP